MPAGVDILPARYRDAELIGRGGMGEIFRARDEVLGRDVAVKLLAERFAGEEEVRERFTREALTAARLSGEKNVVTIFDVGEHRGRPFIVMEHLGGGSLEYLLRREGAQPAARALGWLEDAGRALDAAHAAGIVHRDVKPANLLLDGGGHVHVADFGIASAAGLDSFTRPGTVLGTAGYLSPEQAGGERATPASDRYALGVVAYEAAHARAPIPAISEANPALPGALDPVFERALAKDPSARFASAGELVAAMRDAFDTDAGTTRVAAPVPVPVEPTPPVHRPPPPARRTIGPLGIVLTVLALAVLGGLVAYALTRDDDEAQSQQPQGRTVVRTLVTTAPGTTQRVTVTTQAEEPPPEEEQPPQQGADGVALTDQSTQLLNEGRYEEALPVAQQALAALQGSGELYEAYANYNVGKSLLGLGRCTEAIPYFDRSEQIQGERKEITRDRRAAEKCA
jgi:serine/threonine-protein kinase